ncbi:MAG: protein kinase [Parachlamydiales bacterium]|nr:protein kinase [Candidatus Acheromyda pituitae]
MATTNIHATTLTMQYWRNRFEDGESLDDLTSRLEALYQKKLTENDMVDNDPVLENKVKDWFETTLTEAINAKEHYYANTVTGQISSFFQWVAETFLGCAGYTTSLQHANLFLNTVKDTLDFEYVNFEPVEEQNPITSSRNEFFHPSFLEVSLFCELHQDQMLEIAKSENKAQFLKVPGQEDTSIYAMPDGNCYLVSITKANKIANGATKEVYRAYDLVNRKTVAFMRSNEEEDSSYPRNFSLVKNEYAAFKYFDGVSGILQVCNGFVQNGRVAFFSDYYAEKSLLHFLSRDQHQAEDGRLSPKQEHHLMFKILEGAEAVHNRGYLHRDLKDANILVQKVAIEDEELYEPILIDFDRCCKANDQDARGNSASTPDYWPPEYVGLVNDFEKLKEQGEQANRKDLAAASSRLAEVTNARMDVWALGIILYHIHYGKKLPWEDAPFVPKLNIITKLKDGWFNPKEDDKIGQVIKGMLQVDPSTRMTLAEALLELEKIGDELGEPL